MILRHQLETQGAALFRWRSFIPFAILPLALLAGYSSSAFPDGHAGLSDRLYDLGCILLSFLGLGIRAFTVASAAPRTSGRNTKEQRADSLNTSGIYSMVRNPLYLANFITFLGMIMFLKEWWLVVIATLSYVMYYERIVMAEERYLLDKFGEIYSEWANRTPVMIPNFRLWKKPEVPVSIRRILRREYNGFFLIVAVFYLLEWCDRLLCYRNAAGPMTVQQAPGLYWTSFFAAGAVIFLILRTLKKHTHLLDDEGR